MPYQTLYSLSFLLSINVTVISAFRRKLWRYTQSIGDLFYCHIQLCCTILIAFWWGNHFRNQALVDLLYRFLSLRVTNVLIIRNLSGLQFHCCGIHNSSDFKKAQKFKDVYLGPEFGVNVTGRFYSIDVPISCCKVSLWDEVLKLTSHLLVAGSSLNALILNRTDLWFNVMNSSSTFNLCKYAGLVLSSLPWLPLKCVATHAHTEKNWNFWVKWFQIWHISLWLCWLANLVKPGLFDFFS